MKGSGKPPTAAPAEGVPPEYRYRCPVCGALVDTRDREAMARHQRHVLFPPQDDRPRESSPAK